MKRMIATMTVILMTVIAPNITSAETESDRLSACYNAGQQIQQMRDLGATLDNNASFKNAVVVARQFCRVGKPEEMSAVEVIKEHQK